jgi:radical SAM protein with 4Fe4S-binding SPASM domain
MEKEIAKKIFDIFLEHYDMCKNDPQTLIMNRANSTLLKSPLFISWEITSACNLSCKHCRASENISCSSTLHPSFNAYKRIIIEFAKNEVFMVGVTGGEPLLHPYIFDILNELKKNNLSIILYTNATLINDKNAKMLKEILSNDDIVHVSLDGGNLESNDLQRGKGTFDKVLFALDCLKEHEIKVRLNIVPTIFNVDSIEDLCEIAIEKNVSEFGASPLMTIGRAKTGELAPNIRKLFDVEIRVAERLKNSGVNYIGGISGNISNFLEIPELFDFGIYKLEREISSVKICDAGNRKIFIDALGDVYPCSLFAGYLEFICGNLFNDNLQHIWNSNKFNIFREGIAVCSTCKNCRLFSVCNGGCMALSFSHFGKLNYPDPRCKKSKECAL